jgi:catechol 2,3-dioxygenase
MQSQSQPDQGQPHVHPATHIGATSLTVADLDRSLQFYTEVIGLTVLTQTEQTAILGTHAGHALLGLTQQASARPQLPYTTGLYHIAILLPSRADLALFVVRLAATKYPLDGVADHLVSEALYLSDPDGNGLEVYRDRPRETWQWHNGLVQMATDPLDVEALLTEGQQLAAAEEHWREVPAGTVIGHMHLRVGNIGQAQQFYVDLLGFEVTQRLPGALFISAGGYHHHIGLNTWQSRGAPRPPENSVGLRLFTIELPAAEELTRVQERLQAASWPLERHGDEIAVPDPWGNILLLTPKSLSARDLASV